MRLIFFKFLWIGLISSTMVSQETNYWFNQSGAISALKGGVETAGVTNASAIYYNPGALSFIDEDAIEGQLDILSIDLISIENAGGENVDLSSLTSEVTPAMFAYLKKSNKNSKVTYGFGIISKTTFNNSFDLRYENKGEYLLPIDNVDVFQGKYQYNNKLTENWFIGSFSYRLSDIIGIGLSTNVSLRIQDYFKSYDARALPEDELGSYQQSFSNITSNIDSQSFEYRGLGIIFKPGISINLDKIKLGLVLTTPNINVGILNSFSSKSQLSFLPDEPQSIINKSNSHSFYNGVYKTPLSINVGMEYFFNKTSIAMTTEWFSKIDKYQMVKKKNVSEDLEYPTAKDSKYATPVMANKSIVNVGFSVVHKFKESLKYVGSFRTDFNYFDDKSLDRNTDFVPYLSFWDVYHITSGLVFTGKKIDLTLGINYGFNKTNNDQQFVNMTTANQSNNLRGIINSNTSTQFQNISLIVGINFNLTKKNN